MYGSYIDIRDLDVIHIYKDKDCKENIEESIIEDNIIPVLTHETIHIVLIKIGEKDHNIIDIFEGMIINLYKYKLISNYNYDGWG